LFEEEICLYLIRGLGLEYKAIVTSITTQSSLSLEDIQGMLLNYELCLSHHFSSPIAIIALHGCEIFHTSGPSHGARGNRSPSGRGRSDGMELPKLFAKSVAKIIIQLLTAINKVIMRTLHLPKIFLIL
jgi:hypothetical protein